MIGLGEGGFVATSVSSLAGLAPLHSWFRHFHVNSSRAGLSHSAAALERVALAPHFFITIELLHRLWKPCPRAGELGTARLRSSAFAEDRRPTANDGLLRGRGELAHGVDEGVSCAGQSAVAAVGYA